MAHIGMFVPASYASFRVIDRLFTSMLKCLLLLKIFNVMMSGLSHNDDIEQNQSSFFKECKETAFILENAESRSLVAIDEFGRATSTNDGVAIAWAVLEKLQFCKVCHFMIKNCSDFLDLFRDSLSLQHIFTN